MSAGRLRFPVPAGRRSRPMRSIRASRHRFSGWCSAPMAGPARMTAPPPMRRRPRGDRNGGPIAEPMRRHRPARPATTAPRNPFPAMLMPHPRHHRLRNMASRFGNNGVACAAGIGAYEPAIAAGAATIIVFAYTSFPRVSWAATGVAAWLAAPAADLPGMRRIYAKIPAAYRTAPPTGLAARLQPPLIVFIASSFGFLFSRIRMTDTAASLKEN